MNESKANLVYPELSYKLMGVFFEVQNKLGNKFLEINLGNAIEAIPIRDKVKYEREQPITLNFEGGKLGDFFLDFVVEDKIILELKRVYTITPNHIKQALRYLDGSNLKLCIIVNFTYKKIQYKRVINPKSLN